LDGFGERLRATREWLGITLDEVEAETKIRKLYIEALENENFAILPPQVYAIGFVKQYARVLKLDEELVCAEFKQVAYPEVIPEPVAEKPVRKRRKIQLPRLPYRNLAGAVVFLLLAIWVGNLFANYLGDKMTPAPPAPPVQSGEKNPPAADQSEAPAAVPMEIRVKVKPGMQCWIRVVTDGGNKTEMTLAEEQEETFTARANLQLRLGNAGAVDVTVNGKPVAALGEMGQVVEKEFKNSDNY